jgi:F-type H+-transporting ATPase subunit epsilon
MSEKFKIELVTPKGIVLDKQVEEVIAPGIMGEFGVLIGHTPMLTFIKPGILSCLENDQFTRFVVGSGFCEVLKDSVTVLVDEAFGRDDIDPAEAAKDLEAVQKQLSESDALADPKGYQNLLNKLQLIKYKIGLAGAS